MKAIRSIRHQDGAAGFKREGRRKRLDTAVLSLALLGGITPPAYATTYWAKQASDLPASIQCGDNANLDSSYSSPSSCASSIFFADQNLDAMIYQWEQECANVFGMYAMNGQGYAPAQGKCNGGFWGSYSYDHSASVVCNCLPRRPIMQNTTP